MSARCVLLAVVAWLVWRGVSNFQANARALGLSAGFGFLHTQAGFQIAQTLIAFSPASSYLDAIIVAALNTLLVVALASVLSTLIGLCIAFGRLAPGGLVRSASSVYVEVFRNIPLLLQILFWYFSAIVLLPGVGDSIQFGAVLLNNRGLFFPRVADDVDRRLRGGCGARGLCRVVDIGAPYARVESDQGPRWLGARRGGAHRAVLRAARADGCPAFRAGLARTWTASTSAAASRYCPS